MYPTSNSLEDEWKHRDEAVEAAVLCYGVLKGGPLRRRRNKQRWNLDKDTSISWRQKQRESLLSSQDELLRATEFNSSRPNKWVDFGLGQE